MGKVSNANLAAEIGCFKKQHTQWHISWAYVGGMLCAAGGYPAQAGMLDGVTLPIVGSPSLGDGPWVTNSLTIGTTQIKVPFEQAHKWQLKAPGLLELEGTAFAIAYNEKTFDYELHQFGKIILTWKDLNFIKRVGWDRAIALQEMDLPLK